MERASFGTRLVAAVVDAVVVSVGSALLLLVLGRGLGSSAALLGSLAYFTYFEGGPSGQTPGKRVVGIRVVGIAGGDDDADSADAGGEIGPGGVDAVGGEAGYGKAAVRFVCRLLSAAPCLLGFIWMLFDEDHETWHDKLSATAVWRT